MLMARKKNQTAQIKQFEDSLHVTLQIQCVVAKNVEKKL